MIEMKYLVYDDCEEMVLYIGDNKEEAVSSVENHIVDGYGELSNVRMFEIAKEISFRVSRVTVEEDA